MEKDKYTREQVAEGNQFYSAIESVPPDKRPVVELMAEAFINGMKAAQALMPVRDST